MGLNLPLWGGRRFQNGTAEEALSANWTVLPRPDCDLWGVPESLLWCYNRLDEDLKSIRGPLEGSPAGFWRILEPQFRLIASRKETRQSIPVGKSLPALTDSEAAVASDRDWPAGKEVPRSRRDTGDQMISVPRWITSMALLTLLALPQVSWSQDYSMYFDTSETAPSGSSIQIRCLLDNPGGNLAGWSFAVCEDTSANDYDFTEASHGDGTLTANGGSPAAFAELTVCPGEGIIQGVVIDFVGINELPIGSEYEMIVIDVDLLGPDDTFSPVAYCNSSFSCSTSSPTETLVVPPGGGGGIVPEQIEGLIEIGGLPPFSLSASTSAPSAEQGTSVGLDITVDAPLEYYGFSFGLAHDGAQLTLVSAQAGASLQALNGGAGPEYFLPILDPVGADGLVIACIASTESGSLSTIPPGTDEHLVSASYDVLATAVPGQTSFNFTESLVPAPGSPATPILISLGNIAAIVNTSGANLEVTEAPLGTPFKRGDFDANGNVNLADPINILQYQFNNGPEPSCLKIIDIDDSGSIQLNDPVLLLTYLFSGGEPPEEPFDSCGIDPTEDTITCESFDACP